MAVRGPICCSWAGLDLSRFSGVRGRQNTSAVLGLHGASRDLLSALHHWAVHALAELGCGLQLKWAGLIGFYS
jgi:hypothetical protein